MKTEYSHDHVPLDPELAAVLLKRREQSLFKQGDDWVFPNPATGKPYWQEEIQKRHIAAAAKSAGLPGIGWHTFRHTYRTLLDETGAPMKVQQELMRHASIQTTMNVYGQALSETNRPDGPVLDQSLDELVVHEISCDRPRRFVFGLRSAVASEDGKLLRDLSRRARDPDDIRVALSEINRRSAGRSRGFISDECMVTSLLPDGSSAFDNFGGTAGIPHDIMGTTHLAEVIAKTFKAVPGHKPTFLQGRGAQSEGESVTIVPMNVSAGNPLILSSTSSALFVTDSLGNTFTRMPRPQSQNAEAVNTPITAEIGQPRMVKFSSPTASAWIKAPDRSKLGSILFDGVSGNAKLRKNQLVTTVLNTVTLRLDPTARYEGPPFSLLLQVPNLPTVDGAQPHSWVYGIDVRFQEACTVSIRQNSMAFRSANHKSPMPVLASTEELAIAAPASPIVLTASADKPIAAATIEARFLLRDFSEPARQTSQHTNFGARSKAGRNDPCPCGSGKKYKKCCAQV